MTYTKIGVVAHGLVKSGVICDLETGSRTITSGNGWSYGYERKRVQYAKMAVSPNLEERRAYERIISVMAAAYTPVVLKRVLPAPKRQELLEMINNPKLRIKSREDYWGYLDGWWITIAIDGKDEVPKELGDLNYFNPRGSESRIEQIINIVTDNHKLLFF